MKKLIFLLLICFGLFCQNVKAQLPPPCGMAGDEPPGCTLCGPIFAGTIIYVGTTGGYTPNITPPGFCGSIENNQWLSFVADSTSAAVSITSFNCQYGQGVQLYMLDLNLNPVSNCISSGGNNLSGNVTATGLTPDELYLIMIDGFAGDICDIVIQVVGGISQGVSDPPGPISAEPNVLPLCGGTEVCYSIAPVNGTSVYRWQIPSFGTIISGQNTNEICVAWNEAGVGDVSVSVGNSCFPGGSSKFSVDVVASVPPLFEEISPAGIWQPSRNPGSIKLNYDTTQQLQFYWDTGDTTPDIENLIPGRYCVTVEGLNDCKINDCFTVPGDIYKLSPFHTLCRGSSKRLSIRPQTGATFHWQPAAGLSCTDCPNPVVSPRVTTTYTVTATLPNGYSEDYNVAVVVLPPSICDFAQSKEFDTKEETEAFLRPYDLEIESKNRDIADVFLFPNPGNGELNLRTNRVILSVAIFNHLGDLVSETEPFSDTAVVDFGNAKGVFYLKILTTDGTVYKRAIIH